MAKSNKGHDNLIPFDKLTENEQRKIASAGGKKSGETRRKKKTMRECMELLLSLPATNEQDRAVLLAAGAAELGEDATNLMVVNAALMNAAKAGDVQAVKELRNVVRDDERLKLEKERVKIEQAYLKMKQSGDQSSLDKLDELLSQFLDGD